MGETPTVLIVDDDAGMRLTLDRIFASQGYRVLVASGGAEALEIAAREPFDFALVDYRMSGLNGGEVCASLSDRRGEAALYLMTAHVSPEAVQAAAAHGTSGIFYKPLDLPMVLATLGEKTSRRPMAAGTPRGEG
jgi:two-component system response regulator (stage 0 sporulation protein F)